MSNALRIPSYRRHKPTDKAVVTINGRDIYLGKYNSAESRQEYSRLIAEWTAHNGTIPKQSADLTVAELLAAFLRHAKSYYGKKEHDQFLFSMKPVKALYGRKPVANFGPLALKAVRQTMIDLDWTRGVVNQRTNRIRHIFKWGVENEIVPADVLHGLQAVAGLRYGRTTAREAEPVKPVPEAFIDAVLPHVSPVVASMIELQTITGMRSGELIIMRAGDLNMSGGVWVYTPSQHKTQYRGHRRQVYLGPKAQEIVKPFLKPDLQAYLFSPVDSAAACFARRFGVISADRKTPAYPSELRSRQRRYEERRKGRKRDPRQRNRFDTSTYYQAVQYGINRANKARLKAAEIEGIDPKDVQLIPHWHPHQLRHNAATNLRREHGIEIARIILGHRSAAITEVYAEVDHARAIDVMAKIG